MSKISWDFKPGSPADQLVEDIRSKTGCGGFDLAVVLGSGWHEVAQLGEKLGIFEYRDWPCFPAGQIEGHSGQLIVSRVSSWKILFFSGRFHCYQGLTAYQAAFPVRLAAALGCKRILLSCATGAVNRAYQPGDFMLVDDHINLLGDNPLSGMSGDVFVDLVGLYRQDIYAKLLASSNDEMVLHRGVLAAMSGPSYETPAEISMLAAAGADVVSMSTVPEAIMARYLGLQVAAVAFVANFAAGLGSAAVSHQEVLARGQGSAHLFPSLVQRFITSWQALSVGNYD